MPADETLNFPDVPDVPELPDDTGDSTDPVGPDNPDDLDRIEPGAEGPIGQGVEGADTILEEERPHDLEDGLDRYGDLEGTDNVDDSTAAEQGNREGDEMVSEGDDPDEVAELGVDDQDIDVVEPDDEPLAEERLSEGLDIDGEAAGLTGDVEGRDPLAGGPSQ